MPSRAGIVSDKRFENLATLLDLQSIRNRGQAEEIKDLKERNEIQADNIEGLMKRLGGLQAGVKKYCNWRLGFYKTNGWSPTVNDEEPAVASPPVLPSPPWA